MSCMMLVSFTYLSKSFVVSIKAYIHAVLSIKNYPDNQIYI